MLIVGIGGTTRPQSTSERALRIALGAAERHGADTLCLAGRDLVMPLYDPASPERTPAARALIGALRSADGVIISSPGYHGSVSGLVKNALDYVEDMRADELVYLQGRAVGCIAVAHGWQAAVNTLRTVRDVVHALRGWPTPYGAALNSAGDLFDGAGSPTAETSASLELIGTECTRFAAGASALTG